MGRLDDAAKRKVVELRRAGLSFRKIKAVLELENIKVSAQAIYLFLKEFQGKSTPEQVDGGITQVLGSVKACGEGSIGGGRPGGWSNHQQWTVVRKSPTTTGYNSSTADSTQHNAAPTALIENISEPSVTGESNRTEVHAGGKTVGEDEEEIQIVSVTSLAQSNKQRESQVTVMDAGSMAGASIRRKVHLSPMSSSVLTVRKRLLDKALLHKARIREAVSQPSQQGTAVCRRGSPGIVGSDSRKLGMLTQTPSFDLNSPRTSVMKSCFGGQPAAGAARRTFQQRDGLSMRPLHPPLQRHSPPCPTIKVANPISLSTAKQGTDIAAGRPQQSLGQSVGHSLTQISQACSQTPNTSLQKPAAEISIQGGLQEHVQMLGAELRNLGLAVRLLAEQQGRLEREQAQQTQLQRHILSTLQDIALRMAPSSQPHNEAPPSCGTPTCNQGQFDNVPVSYVPCSLPQPKLCESGTSGREAVDTYKLSGLSPQRMNDCQPSSSNSGVGDSLSAVHMATHSQTQLQMHVSPCGQTTMLYSQPYVVSYTETYNQPQNDPLQDCSPSTHSSVNPETPPSLLSDDSQFNIIKVETL